MTCYYNEFDPYAAQWLRNLIAADHLPAGDVDERSIVDVAPSDLAGYTQCHFFAGIGGWGLAARLAGWPDDRELWTGSAPCQPFSVAGQGKAQADDRHLWPHLFRLASARRPAVLMGEQVAAAVGKDWLDGIATDMESIGYACGAAVVPAAAVDAPHRRDRLWFVADAHGIARRQGDPHAGRCEDGSRSREVAGLECASDGAMADTRGGRFGEPRQGEVEQSRRAEVVGASDGDVADAERIGFRGERPGAALTAPSGMQGTDGERQRLRADAGAVRVPGSAWSGHGWIIGHDGKARRVEPGIRLLAHGVPARVGRLRAYGNAICVPLAAEVIGAYMDCGTDGR